jgi:hypothetical protein
MSATTTIVINVLLGLGLVSSLLLLLGYPGIHRDRHHRRKLHRWHRDRAARGARPPRHVADH